MYVFLFLCAADEPVSLAVHVGSQIDLPCKSLLANDLPLRINWFKDDSPMPVYSVTYASNQSFHRTNIMQGRHAARSDWSQRAYFSVLGSPATLKVNDLSFQDTGTYVCQVVISRGTQRNATVHLVVVGECRLVPRLSARIVVLGKHFSEYYNVF
ncbi:hypothetical protein V5799_022235 [Amblyomma americanum]|uniref:Ig-like domain-containing protein n=1 Tax=Amblyomma americanum TaxID=6943 RepID=A0AAQ4FL17_AMBAM